MPQVPLIMFSAFADAHTAKQALSAGVSALISKSEQVSVLLGEARRLTYPIAV
jgi:DNA-binding NarL/FixJ family response regulator